MSRVSTTLGSIVRLMTGVLSGTFAGDSWHAWRTLLTAIDDGLGALDDDGRALMHQLTGRSTVPATLAELWIICGRRSGKSIISAALAVWATTCRTYTLAPGEVGVFMVLAADRRQARVLKRYVSGLLHSTPVLAALVEDETADAITLTSGVVIEIHTNSYRSLRGYTCIGATCDEIAFWDSEDSANPDREVLVALRAAMGTVPEALLVCITSPYARRGEAWRTYERFYGKDDSDRVLVVNAPTLLLNPSIELAVIEAAYADDPVAASAEWGGEWRRDVEAFLPPEALEAVRMIGRLEQPPQYGITYTAFLDPAGGTGADSMTLAIAHRHGSVAVLDLVREQRPPFSPEATVQEFAATMKAYRVTTATSDRFAGHWPVEAFSKVGITVKPSERTRSELYLAVLPAVMSGQVELLDHPRLLKQFGSLERRKGRQGKDSVDAPPRMHEDVANAAAGALTLTAAGGGNGGGAIQLRGF
ncbi:MAG: hypothetical protein ABI051_03325 [Vicinamibacterales bacterium]